MGVYRSCLPRRSGGHQGCSPPNIHPPRPARRGGSALAPLLTKPALSAADSHGKTHAVMRAATDKPFLRAAAGAAPSARGGRHRPGPHLSHGGTRAAPRGAACDVAAAAAALLAPPAAGESPAGIKLGLRGCFVRTRSSPPLRVALNGAVQRGSFSLLRLQLAADAIVVRTRRGGKGGPGGSSASAARTGGRRRARRRGHAGSGQHLAAARSSRSADTGTS